jgi:UDP-4-amino-4-deoxy-L-arabinose-oxoglutarate aminotransferase
LGALFWLGAYALSQPGCPTLKPVEDKKQTSQPDSRPTAGRVTRRAPRTEFLPFSRPSITEDDITAVADVLRSRWITTGPKTTEFEQQFSEYVGCPGAVALSSGTAGMHLLLHAMGLGPGDEVITPSMTWVSTVNLIVLSGATPVFADIDRDTLMVTRDSIEEQITKRTRLIIPTHFAGAAANMGPIRALADQKSIAVVEDTAHALGTEYRGVRVGASGTSVFSFHPIKNITTGEGGMVCSDDSPLLEYVRRLKFHGLGADAYDRQTQGRSPQTQVLTPGYKYNMPDLSAVLGLRQLARLEGFNQRRAELAAVYRERLAEVDEILPLSDPPYGMKHSWHLFIVRLDTEKTGMSRDDFMNKLKQRNIGTGLHFRAVHLQKYYRESMGTHAGMLPNTEWNSDRICSLPLFPEMTSDDVDDVVEAIKEILSD